MLDDASPVPLYRQLADELSDQIRSGRFAVGARIPSEHELAATHGIGRPTVRQATELLVRRQLLERRRGAGTFVRAAPREVDLFSLGGTLASFAHSGVALKTRWLRKLKLREVAAAEHDNPFRGQRVYTAVRVGAVARQPVLLERLFFDPGVFPEMDRHPDAAASLSQLVARHYRLRPRAGRQTFRVHRAGAALAATLRVAPGTALLLVKRTLDFARAPGAVFAELYCHTDELVFAQNLAVDIGDHAHA